MSIGDKLKTLKISLEDGAEAAAKKSQNLVEYSELSLSMASCKKKIDEIYLKIGERIYRDFREGDLNISNIKEILEYCTEINDLDRELKKLKRKMLKLKNKKECRSCGRLIEKKAQFCDRCGCKQ
ncbi:hypothetical protein N4T77_05865 [Clostridium sp. CX1]|uniref:hypothetical protein n=1 Tax=Clostridium sp. CX1 TaxID=2978346 RepID=UPI0021C1A18F|nr:hypothetical protein [Clostridium sp. CX1]MCT8976121.1 hypothetical protein [Clostridium sp. CX1]